MVRPLPIPRTDEHVQMVESPLGLIPQGWEVGELGDLAESIRRNVKPEGC